MEQKDISNSFLISKFQENSIFNYNTKMNKYSEVMTWITPVLDFHILVNELRRLKGDFNPCQELILPKKFTDKFGDKVWNNIIDEFYKIVQGVDKPIRTGTPLKIEVSDAYPNDGRVLKNLKYETTHGNIPFPPINNEKYQRFIQEYS